MQIPALCCHSAAAVVYLNRRGNKYLELLRLLPVNPICFFRWERGDTRPRAGVCRPADDGHSP